MNFLIITHTPHLLKKEHYFAYAPYVKEMNLWIKNFDSVEIIAPKVTRAVSKIDMPYKHNNIYLNRVPAIAFTSVKASFKSVIKIPIIFVTLYKACKRADHIHLRCPGNIGLLGCFVQLLFPKKKKTAKYAGNWDPKAKQPFSYRLQKWILSNTFLTRDIQVLVYGEWPKQTKNVLPFFTASYATKNIANIPIRKYDNIIQFVYVGTLSKGKRPLYAVKLVEELLKRGVLCRLAIYGEGEESGALKEYIKKASLESVVTLFGNQPSEVIETAYKKSHFLILASKSEGWPKVVAEAMFWGVIPLATSVSCIPWMMANGKRGILLNLDLNIDAQKVTSLLKQGETLNTMAINAANWSRQYTLEDFETEIKKLI